MGAVKPRPKPEFLPDGTVKIPLTQGKFALIDAVDWPIVSRFRWHAMKDPKGRGDGTFYATTTISLHRLILQDVVNTDASLANLDNRFCGGALVDHKNGDGLDNRRQNLRPATHRENQSNKRLSRANKSGFKGVWFDQKQGSWQVNIKLQSGKQKLIGRFSSPEAAARVYDAWARELYGEFARLNFPESGERSARSSGASDDL